MLKVTITLPDGATVTLEAHEPHTYREIIASAREYLLLNKPSNHNGSPDLTTQGFRPEAPSLPEAPRPVTTVGEGTPNNREFISFCRRLDPAGDMRRVVVAAEGARRYLAMNRVSSRELESLFNTVGWPNPANFLHTLRNAGRSTFRWLQRVPGNSGYYTVTVRGRRQILPQEVEAL